MTPAESRRALAHKIPIVARIWHQLADVTLAEFGVSNSAAWCLIYVDRLGPDVRQINLAEHLEIAQPSLVRTLNLLAAAGLIERQQDAGDRRSNHVNLTAEGHSLVRRIEDKLDVLRRDLLDGVSHDEIVRAVDLLDLLTRRITERRGRP
jgi:MarR family transcriptional regulator for hemolysin